jgi:hypothetical protein
MEDLGRMPVGMRASPAASRATPHGLWMRRWWPGRYRRWRGASRSTIPELRGHHRLSLICSNDLLHILRSPMAETCTCAPHCSSARKMLVVLASPSPVTRATTVIHGAPQAGQFPRWGASLGGCGTPDCPDVATVWDKDTEISRCSMLREIRRTRFTGAP